MTTAAIPPLVLRNGATIEDVLVRTLEFVANDSSYLKYDLAPVARDATLTREDVRTANWMVARMSARVIDGIHERAPRSVPRSPGSQPRRPSPPRTISPWAALKDLFAAVEGIPEVGLARATKVLHKKRPALVPILDSVVAKYLRGVERIPRVGDFAADAVALVGSYKRELDLASPTLRAIQAELHDRRIDLSESRLLDLLLWGYSGTYTPLYRRGEGTAAPARPPGPPAAIFARVEVFRDDDTGYLAWLAAHPLGFVLNAARTPRPDYLILHRASCRTITGRSTRGGPWTGPYQKVCAGNELELAAWAGHHAGGVPVPCRVCRP